jgi:hypothetical protein
MFARLFNEKGTKTAHPVSYALDCVSKESFTEAYKNRLADKKLSIVSIVEISDGYLLLLSHLDGLDPTFEY